jgi:predicted NBD/HSP70 family sugar kinase
MKRGLINRKFSQKALTFPLLLANKATSQGTQLKQRKTYVKSIDAVFGNRRASTVDIKDLTDISWVEERTAGLALGPAAGDVVGLSVERESISWALLGPRGAIASATVEVPLFPMGGEPASADTLHQIIAEAMRDAGEASAQGPLAGVGVAWPGPVDLDGNPHPAAWTGLDFGPTGVDLRELTLAAIKEAGLQMQDGEGGQGPAVTLVNDADADLLYEACLGDVVGGIGDLLGVKIGGGIGLSLIHGGQLVRGHAGRAGEIEHIKVRYEDFPLPDNWNNVRELDELDACSCNGSNCIGRFATGKRIIDQLRDYDDVGASYNERAREIVTEIQKDVVTAVFGRAGKLVGQALLGPVLAFDPERVVVSAFPRSPNFLQGIRTSLTEGTPVKLAPEAIVFASVFRERTATGAGWMVIEQAVIPRIEKAVAGNASLRRFELPHRLRSQVHPDDHAVKGFAAPRSTNGVAT